MAGTMQLGFRDSDRVVNVDVDDTAALSEAAARGTAGEKVRETFEDALVTLTLVADGLFESFENTRRSPDTVTIKLGIGFEVGGTLKILSAKADAAIDVTLVWNGVRDDPKAG